MFLSTYKTIRCANSAREVLYSENYQKSHKDILIIIHNQIDFVKKCIDSIYDNTSDFDLYLWDNDSNIETKDYLKKISMRKNVHLITSYENMGFIEPNNQLIKYTKSDYIILLNSDTEVKSGWDIAMISTLQHNSHIGVVGYCGGLLNESADFCSLSLGEDIDYVCGWCLCIPRHIYNEFGLFNENLKFAYFEDSELSLRLKEAGKGIYALYLDLVYHHGNKTIEEVLQTKLYQEKFAKSFVTNRDYLCSKYTDYLVNKRVLAIQPQLLEEISRLDIS